MSSLSHIVFTGFNSRVIALDQNTGAVLWDWLSPTGTGYVSLLLMDETHLIVSVVGYTYCLDPATGTQLWSNRLDGYGVGVASLVSVSGRGSAHTVLAAAASDDADRSAAQSNT
ncbi:MAG TPA: PQQ-binding-like beta-propeller repeat protein [Terriglobia bacterium]|nr:PQQ-binding-like beta-propeller repeat protein [Terriglobia bacterium]